MSNKEPLYYSREFLNTALQGGVAASETWIGPIIHPGYRDMSLSISDCNRQISLDLDISGPKSARNVRHKLLILLGQIHRLFDEAATAVQEWESGNAKLQHELDDQ